MKRFHPIIPLALLLFVLVAIPAQAGNGYEKFKGEVVAVQQETSNQGADQRITVRTRNGQEKQFRLDGSAGCEGCVQVGDRVQARVSRGSGGESGRVQSMRVKRNGEMFGYSNQSGQWVRTQQRLKDGSGSGMQGRNNGNGPGRGNAGSGNGNRGGGGGKGSGGGRG